MKKLLEEITNCEIIQKTLTENCKSDCEKIIKSQKSNTYKNFQLPEPWNGDIENCKILFLSSNPSFNQDEKYPLGDSDYWTKSDVSDFFINRFSPDKDYVKNELYTLQSAGGYSKNWVRFWAAVRNIARVILDTKSTVAGKDYAMTEIVHCKSRDEEGVQDAMDTCANKFLDKIIKISKAKIIICLGKKTADVVKRRYEIETTEMFFENSAMDKVFLFLPHPNAREERNLNKILTHDELENLKDKVK